MSIFEQLKKNLEELEFNIISEDFSRPWGGFFVIDEKQTQGCLGSITIDVQKFGRFMRELLEY